LLASVCVLFNNSCCSTARLASHPGVLLFNNKACLTSRHRYRPFSIVSLLNFLLSCLADMQAVLDLHNKYRARHGVPALTWSDSIASKAQAYSQDCVMQHSGARGLGENLAMVGRSFFSAILQAANPTHEP
jgi:uncharacterized protein YkwD